MAISGPHVKADEAPASGPQLPNALPGETFRVDGLHCTVAGRGPPLLLVHSINAVSSSAEVRPLFERFSATHTVFAPDLPGFGQSDRSDQRYDARVMTDALHTVSAAIRKRCGTGAIDALAVSTSCEFLARAAVEQSASWHRLAFVSPTGLSGSRPRRGPPGSTRGLPRLHAVLSNPLWAESLYRGLTRPAVIRYFLQKTWGSKAIDETLWAYDVLTARQPGARFAPLYFLSGNFFSADIHAVYEAVSQPVWMSHGVRGDFTDFRQQGRLALRSKWTVTAFATGALPYFEEPAGFAKALAGFLAAEM